MGMMTAMGIAETEMSLEQQIGWHFAANCYPPIPSIMIPVAIEAIDAGFDEDWEREIALPEGITYKGKTTAPASVIIEQHHLHAWLESGDDE